jgi:F-type H+-transporting ATPase subunit alpha
LEKQILVIYAGTQGHLDDLPVEVVGPFEEFLYPFVERRAQQIYAEIRDKKELSDPLRETIDRVIQDAKAEFVQAKGIKPAQ